MSSGALGAERDASGEEHAYPQTPAAEGERVNAVPEAVREAARRAFDSRPRDVLVADLVFDSLLDGDRRASADPTRRTLRFGDGDAGADLVVTESASRRVSIQVQALPPQKCEVEVRSTGAPLTLTTTDTGSVVFDAAAGLMSLVIRPIRSTESQPLQTAWVRI
jgi:hypothetical protein